LTDERRAQLFSAEERVLIRRHVPWTVLVREGRVSRDGEPTDLLPYLRRHRDRFVVKPNDEYGGTGVTLGWETTEADWDAALSKAVAERDRGWVAQEKIAVRREVFPICENGSLVSREMLVDFAPYIFRGRSRVSHTAQRTARERHVRWRQVQHSWCLSGKGRSPGRDAEGGSKP
jgi:uncharacterized circularly permuted ATP-grasp superfamily protein